MNPWTLLLNVMPPSGRSDAGNAGRTARGGARSSKTAHLYQTLRSEILTLLLPPGTILVENALAARFSVSKTPIREALALLRRIASSTACPGKGTS